MMTKNEHPLEQIEYDITKTIDRLRRARRLTKMISDETWELVNHINHRVYTGTLNGLNIVLPWQPETVDKVLLSLQKSGFKLVKDSYAAAYGTRYFYFVHSDTGNKSWVDADIAVTMDSRAAESACIVERCGEEVTPLYRVRCAEAV